MAGSAENTGKTGSLVDLSIDLSGLCSIREAAALIIYRGAEELLV